MRHIVLQASALEQLCTRACLDCISLSKHAVHHCCRLIAIDHLHSHVYLIALASCHSPASQALAQDWLQATDTQLHSMLPSKATLQCYAPPAACEPAVEAHSDSMSQLSSQTDHLPDLNSSHMGSVSNHLDTVSNHMGTVSSCTLSDEDMVDDDQAYLSASRSYRRRAGQPSSASASGLGADAAPNSDAPPNSDVSHTLASCGDAPEAKARPSHASEAFDRHTDTQQASDSCSDRHHASHRCTDTSHASDRRTDAAGMPADAPPPFKLARSRQQYLKDVEACQQALHDGDSYEICLTTALVREHPIDPLQLYRMLRSVNPAPYAAWLSFGGTEDLQICCASPERFLKVRADWAYVHSSMGILASI